MGNRANVIFTDGKEYSPAIYLHWNGGPESIYAFLAEMDRRQIRTGDTMYESARFCHIVGDFFDGDKLTGLSLGLTNGPKSDKPKDIAKIQTDPGDNGFYLVHRQQNGKGIKTNVRRFMYDYDNKTVKEMDKSEVDLEKQVAMKSDYIPDIAAKFLELTKGKEISGY